MQVSTIEFYDAINRLAGNTQDAKIIADYVEQTKQTNYSTLKDVFMVKEDKSGIIAEIQKVQLDLRDYVNKKFERQTYILIAVMSIGFTILGFLLRK